MSSSRKSNKFSNLNEEPDAESESIPEEPEEIENSQKEDQYEQSIGKKLENEDLGQYRENNFVESVGNEYNQLMNELGKKIDQPLGRNSPGVTSPPHPSISWMTKKSKGLLEERAKRSSLR